MLYSRSGTDRVAHRHSDVIDEVDGVPSTHTPRTAGHDWTVTTRPASAAPLPFGAPLPIGAIPAVTAMALIVLGATCIAVLTVYDGHPDRFRILAGLLALVVMECLALLLVAVLRPNRKTARSASIEPSREGIEPASARCPESFESDATLLDHRLAPWSGETR